MVRKISGKSKSASYHHLNYNFNNANETASTVSEFWFLIHQDVYHDLFVCS